MGFWDDASETLFGTQTKKRSQHAASDAAAATAAAGEAARAQAEKIGTMQPGIEALGKKYAALGTAAGVNAGIAGNNAAQYKGQGDYYDAATKESMGKNAAEYMQNAQNSAQSGANQAGNAAMLQGTKGALQAARSSGLSKGQAALTSGQQAGDIYSNVYQGGLESGKNQYMQGTQQLAGQGAEMANRGVQQQGLQAQQQGLQQGAAGGEQGALNTTLGMYGAQNAAINGQQNAAAQQAQQAQNGMQNAANTAGQTWGTIGTLAGVGANMLSDERTKTKVEDLRKQVDSLDLKKIAKSIRPVKFEYKDGAQNIDAKAVPGVEHLGVMAQDLEKTPLASVVKTGDDGIKRIDTAELTPALLNLVIQLAQKVQNMEGAK